MSARFVEAQPWWRPGAPSALAVMIVLLATASRHGFHGDELYFRMLPPAWWYDDQPPLTVWLAHAAASVSDAVWVQRLPAALAAGAGALVAGLFPRLLGADVRVQRIAAWAHAFTVYPLLMGHVMLTASLDLLAWQLVVLGVVAALTGRRHALTWAGAAAGAACWNKLLVLVLVAAAFIALAACARWVLRTRDAWCGAALLVAVGGFQVGAQIVHGVPMLDVSADLVARHGALNRWLVVPLLVVFVGPPFVQVAWRGLWWRPGSRRAARPGADDGHDDGRHVEADGWRSAPADDARVKAFGVVTNDPFSTDDGHAGRIAPDPPQQRTGPVLAVVAAIVLVFALVSPAQPYYAVAVFLPLVAVGWARAAADEEHVWRRAPIVVTANAVVAALICLPIAPVSSPAFSIVSALDPMQRDQTDWPSLAAQMATARPTGAAIVTDSYALAGAAHQYGPALGVPRADVASWHNALWSLGPPRSDGGTRDVLAVGGDEHRIRAAFTRCDPAGRLIAPHDPFGLDGTTMLRCSDPRGGWGAVWPTLRRLGG
ncbi:hypothetical protein ACWKWA_10370 [Dermacoccus abyssi]